MIQLAGGKYSQLSDWVRGQSGRQRTYISALPVREDKTKCLWVTAQHVPVYTFLGSPPWSPPAEIQGHHCWLCWTPRATSFSWAIRHATLHFVAGLFLDWEKREWDGLLPATPAFCISMAWWSHWLSSVGIVGDEPLPQLSDTNRAAQASRVCLSLCCLRRYPSLHPVTCWYPLPGFLCLHLRIQIVRDAERWVEGKLSCHEGTVSINLIQVLSLKTQREEGRDNRSLLTLLLASILPQWMSVCEHLWWHFINTNN